MNEYHLLKQSNLVPDGIFINPQNERICFEYEISVKAKARYQSKVKVSQKVTDQVLVLGLLKFFSKIHF